MLTWTIWDWLRCECFLEKTTLARAGWGKPPCPVRRGRGERRSLVCGPFIPCSPLYSTGQTAWIRLRRSRVPAGSISALNFSAFATAFACGPTPAVATLSPSTQMIGSAMLESAQRAMTVAGKVPGERLHRSRPRERPPAPGAGGRPRAWGRGVSPPALCPPQSWRVVRTQASRNRSFGSMG